MEFQKCMGQDLDAKAIEALRLAATYYGVRDKAKVVFWFADIGREEVLRLYRRRRKIIRSDQTDNLVLVLNTPGGEVDAAYMLVQVLRANCKHLTIIIPLWAKSAGTLVCLGADSLVMSGIAEMGPLDPQIRRPGETLHTSALDAYQAVETIKNDAVDLMDFVTQVVIHRTRGMRIGDILPYTTTFAADLMKPLTAQIQPEQLGYIRRSLDVSAKYATRLLQKRNLPPEQIDETVNQLVFEYPDHSFAIDINEARSLGFPVQGPSDETEDRVLDALIAVAAREITVIGAYPTIQQSNLKVAASEQESVTNESEVSSDKLGNATSESAPPVNGEPAPQEEPLDGGSPETYGSLSEERVKEREQPAQDGNGQPEQHSEGPRDAVDPDQGSGSDA